MALGAIDEWENTNAKTLIWQILTLRSYSLEVNAEEEDEAIESVNNLNSLEDLDKLAELD